MSKQVNESAAQDCRVEELARPPSQSVPEPASADPRVSLTREQIEHYRRTGLIVGNLRNALSDQALAAQNRDLREQLAAKSNDNAASPERPRIVCLCGSTRFIAQMACIAWALERDEGYITLGMHLLPDNYPDVQADHMAEHEGKKEHFDELHKRKIDLADEVLVINIGGYVGESTRSEIDYALAHGKPVKYIEKEKQ